MRLLTVLTPWEEFARRIQEQYAAMIADINARIVKSVTPSTSKLLEGVSQSLRDAADAYTSAASEQIARIGRDLAEAASQWTQFGERMQELWEEARPPNWPPGPRASDVFDAVRDTGWPLVWVPRAAVVTAIAAADPASRADVLLAHRAEVTEDVRLITGEIRNAQLIRFVDPLIEAANGIDAGFSRGAQALAAAVLTELLVEVGFKSFREARDDLPGDLDEIGIRHLRFGITCHSILVALETFWQPNGDPIPEKYNRHATHHTVSDIQYTEVNALAGLMVAASFLRELESRRSRPS